MSWRLVCFDVMQMSNNQCFAQIECDYNISFGSVSVVRFGLKQSGKLVNFFALSW